MRRAAPLVCILAAVACGSGYAPTIVLGPYQAGAPGPLWEQTLAAVRSTSYEPTYADAARGRIVVPSRIYGTREPIVLQLYRDGWVEVGVGADRPMKFRTRIPADLRQEHLELSITLREAMEGTAERERREEERPARELGEPGS